VTGVSETVSPSVGDLTDSQVKKSYALNHGYDGRQTIDDKYAARHRPLSIVYRPGMPKTILALNVDISNVGVYGMLPPEPVVKVHVSE